MLFRSGGGVFYIFAGVCVLCLVFMWYFVPETKGKTLEHIERELFGIDGAPKSDPLPQP